MRSMRSARFRVDHLLTIAMVGGNYRCSFNSLDRANDPAQTGIERFDRLDCRIEHSGVPDHIAIGVVDNVDILIALIKRATDSVGYFECAHIRLQIVGCHLGRGHEDAAFMGKLFLDATIEKISDVRIFLSLGDPEVVDAESGEYFSQRVVERDWRKDDRRSKGAVILSKCRKVQIFDYF